MYEDQTLKCVDCGNDFIFSARDQEFFETMKYTPPKRCRPCRAIKKQKRFNEQSNRPEEGYGRQEEI